MRTWGWRLLGTLALGVAVPALACINAIGTDHQGRHFPLHEEVGEGGMKLTARLDEAATAKLRAWQVA